MKHSIVIVDDHMLIAQALTVIVNDFSSYHVLYNVQHGKALMDRLTQGHQVPDIVLLDVEMPVMDGLETAEWLTKHYPAVRILTLTMLDEEQTLLQMIRAGARGYILKGIEKTELEHALNSLIETGYYWPGWVTARLARKLTGADINQDAQMNDREREFLRYAATELTYKEIAEKMSCSARTVDGYRDALFEKFTVKSRVGLVMFALKHRFIKL